MVTGTIVGSPEIAASAVHADAREDDDQHGGGADPVRDPASDRARRRRHEREAGRA
jgi:hypothetical protein